MDGEREDRRRVRLALRPHRDAVADRASVEGLLRSHEHAALPGVERPHRDRRRGSRGRITKSPRLSKNTSASTEEARSLTACALSWS